MELKKLDPYCTIQHACDVLHIDEGPNNELVRGLIDAVPSYIATTTGMLPCQQAEEPLVPVVGDFLLTLWYYGDHSDDLKLQRTIDNLLKCITLKVYRG